MLSRVEAFDKILTMSPRALALKRREKENEDVDLPHHEMVSDTGGYHVNAEDHPDE